jgi:rhodanese-related sulfurtransferase
VVIYCAIGHRGSIALVMLNMLGWENASSLKLGLNGWKSASMPVAGWIDWQAVFGDYLANLPEGYATIKAADLNLALAENPPFLLDIREESELNEAGHIAGAIHLPTREVFAHLEVLPEKDQPIVVYCASGHRGGMVMAALQMLGYTDVKNLAGGIGAWKKAEFPVEAGLPEPPHEVVEVEVDPTMLRDFNAFFSALPGFYTVSAADLNTEIAGGTVPVIIDLRTEAEITSGGKIAEAAHIVIDDLLADMTKLPSDKAAPIVLVCQSGHRGGMALVILRMLGYTEVRNLGGGMNAWVAAELPVAQ